MGVVGWCWSVLVLSCGICALHLIPLKTEIHLNAQHVPHLNQQRKEKNIRHKPQKRAKTTRQIKYNKRKQTFKLRKCSTSPNDSSAASTLCRAAIVTGVGCARMCNTRADVDAPAAAVWAAAFAAAAAARDIVFCCEMDMR